MTGRLGSSLQPGEKRPGWHELVACACGNKRVLGFGHDDAQPGCSTPSTRALSEHRSEPVDVANILTTPLSIRDYEDLLHHPDDSDHNGFDKGIDVGHEARERRLTSIILISIAPSVQKSVLSQGTHRIKFNPSPKHLRAITRHPTSIGITSRCANGSISRRVGLDRSRRAHPPTSLS